MKWLRNLRKPKAPEPTKPTKQLTISEASSQFDAMLAHQKSSTEINVASEAYIRSVWVYGAVSTIAEYVSRTPFRIKSRDSEVTDGDLFKLVNRPNRYGNQDTSTKFRNAYMTEVLLNGAVMRLFTEIQGIQPLEMTVYPRSRFRAETAEDKNGKEMVRRWILTTKSQNKTFIPNDEIYHDVLYNPSHDWEGLAPLTAALNMVNNDVNVSEFVNRYFKNDASPGFFFSSDDPTFDNERAKEATKMWNDKHQGVLNAWKTVFLGHNLKGERVSAGLDANILAALKGLTKQEIVTGIFKVPLSIFGEQQATAGVVIGGSGAASEAQKETFLVSVIIPWARWYDEEFNNDVAWRFGPQFTGEHDFTQNPVLENRRLERAKAAAELLKHGATLNSIIRWMRLELEESPWGDEWFIPNSMIPASVLLAAGDKLLDNLAQNNNANTPTKQKKEVIDKYLTKIGEMAESRLLSGLHDTEIKIAETISRYEGTNGHGTRI